MMSESTVGAENGARTTFSSARRQAFWSNLRNRFGHRCNDLLPTSRVLAELQLSERKTLGVVQVPVERIVGSTGRYREFDLAFRPLDDRVGDRWKGIASAHQQGAKLPPITLYKVGDAYFVEDGNHRLSVARARGQDFIEALVIEFDPSALEAKGSCQRLGYKV